MNILIDMATVLFGWIVIYLLATWLLALLYPTLAPALRPLVAPKAATYTLLYSAIAPVAATLTLLLLFTPRAGFFLVHDHCHGTLCTPHEVQLTLATPLGRASVGVLALLFVGTLVSIGLQLCRGGQRLRVLRHLSETTSASFRTVNSADQLAWCAGLIQPQVYVSKGLLQTLAARQLQLVLAHELAHAQRYDNLQRSLLTWNSLCWPASLQQRIRQQFELYSEQACDLAAVRALGADSWNARRELLELLAQLPEAKAAPDRTLCEQRMAALEQALKQEADATISARQDGRLALLYLTTVTVAISLAGLSIGHPWLEWLGR